MDNENAKKIALWRFQIIAPLLTLSGPRGTLSRELRRLSQRTHLEPLRGPVHVGYGTIEGWLYL